MIPVYNCAQTIKETIESVLVQDLGPAQMQIEVVDDASTDVDVEALVAELGQGRIGYTRQAQNVGSLRNFETCIQRAQGHLVHLLHGDDIVYDGYYRELTRLFEQNPQAGAAFCRHDFIDHSGKQVWQETEEAAQAGILDDWFIRLARRQRIQYCSITVKREVYEKLGAFYGVTYGEDWEMWTRIAHQYPMAYTPQVLAGYRVHTSSISHESFRTSQNLRDLQWVIQTIQGLLPEDKRDEVKRDSLTYFAHYGLWCAGRIWQVTRDWKSAAALVKESFHMHADARMYLKVGKLCYKMGLYWLSYKPLKAMHSSRLIDLPATQ